MSTRLSVENMDNTHECMLTVQSIIHLLVYDKTHNRKCLDIFCGTMCVCTRSIMQDSQVTHRTDTTHNVPRNCYCEVSMCPKILTVL